MAQLRIAACVAEFTENEWDALIDDDGFYQCHAWLSALEEQFGSCGVIVAETDDGLVGALPMWAGEHGAPGLFHLPALFADIPGDWGGQFLWLGGHRSVRNLPLLASSAPELTDDLFRFARETARRRGLTGVVMSHVPIETAIELGARSPAIHVILHSAEGEMEVPPDGLAGHLHQISKRDRVMQRAELRRFRAAGNRVTWTRLTDKIEPEVSRLIAQNRAKHGSRQGPGWVHHSFEAQRRSGVRDRAVAGICSRDGRTVAALVCYRFRSHLHARYFGFDYAAHEPGHEYFVLSYGLILDFAARHGFDRYHLATSALDIKARRGASLVPQAAVVLTVDDRWPAAADVKNQNRRFAADFDQRFGHRLGRTEWHRWLTDIPRPQ